MVPSCRCHVIMPMLASVGSSSLVWRKRVLIVWQVRERQLYGGTVRVCVPMPQQRHLSCSLPRTGFERWQAEAQWPFVEQSKSPKALYRAFYVPQMSQRNNYRSDYVVLQRPEKKHKRSWLRQ